LTRHIINSYRIYVFEVAKPEPDLKLIKIAGAFFFAVFVKGRREG
jgi:hypothetical protein